MPATEMANAPVVPAGIVRGAGDSVMAKSWTARTLEPLLLSEPFWSSPLTVTAKLPAPLLGAVTVTVEEPEPQAGTGAQTVAGLNAADAPDGSPTELSSTVPMN
jgi:hypothetical protein